MSAPACTRKILPEEVAKQMRAAPEHCRSPFPASSGTSVDSLPRFLRELLDAPPAAGDGVHGWMFRVARHLHAHWPAGQIVRLLSERVASCGRHVPHTEITAAVRSSLDCAWQPLGRAGPAGSAAKWPEPNPEQIEVVQQGAGLADLWEMSPTRIEGDREQVEAILDQLFPGNPLLCCGHSQSEFDTKPLTDWRGQLSQLQFIVPNPMSARRGRKKNPQPGQSVWSAHTLDNTGLRRFLVVECDFSLYARDGRTETKLAPWLHRQAQSGITIADICVAVLLHLAHCAPLVLAVHSGGKSLHGWFYCDGQPEDKLLRFMRYAVSLGADPATWTRSQFVRMPEGTRDNGRRQTVYFFNSKPLEVPRI